MASLHPPASRIGDLLLQRGLITRTQLDDAIAEQKSSHRYLGEILVSRQLITERQLKQNLKWQSLLRNVCIVTAFALTPWHNAQANSESIEEDNYEETLGSYLSHQNNPSLGSPKSNDSYQLKTSGQKLSNQLKEIFGSTMLTFLTGKYESGVDKHSKGMRYKAKWSNKSVRVEWKLKF